MPAARLDDFTRSMRTALWWQLGVFALALVLCGQLPVIRLDAEGPMAGGASPRLGTRQQVRISSGA